MGIPLKVKIRNNIERFRRKNLILLAALLTLVVDLVEHAIDDFIKLMFMILPLAVYVALLQTRDKPPSTTNLANHISEYSTYQIIAPGIILVCMNGREFKDRKQAFLREWSKIKPTLMDTLKIMTYILIVISTIVYLYFKLHG